MPLYGVAQSGPNITSPGLNLTVLYPGDSFTLFSGAETPSASPATTSVAIQRGPSPAAGDNGMSFFCQGMPAGTTIDIEAANTDVEADYSSLTTLAPDANGDAFYTDVGRALFYRAKYTAYTSGAMAVVKVQR